MASVLEDAIFRVDLTPFPIEKGVNGKENIDKIHQNLTRRITKQLGLLLNVPDEFLGDYIGTYVGGYSPFLRFNVFIREQNIKDSLVLKTLKTALENSKIFYDENLVKKRHIWEPDRIEITMTHSSEVHLFLVYVAGFTNKNFDNLHDSYPEERPGVVRCLTPGGESHFYDLSASTQRGTIRSIQTPTCLDRQSDLKIDYIQNEPFYRNRATLHAYREITRCLERDKQTAIEDRAKKDNGEVVATRPAILPAPSPMLHQYGITILPVIDLAAKLETPNAAATAVAATFP